MAQWSFETILAGCIGGLVSGGFLLLTDQLRHLRLKTERYQTILAEKRLSAYDTLRKMLIELHADLSPISWGVEPLRWPKDKRVTPEPTEQQEELAQRVDRRITELTHFVATNEVVLGREVVKVCNLYYGALGSMRAHIRVRTEDDVFVADALDRLMCEFIDKVSEAIKKELHSVGVEFSPTPEWQSLRRHGKELADRFIAEAKKGYP